MFKTLCGLGI